MAAEARPGRAGAASGGASGPAGGVCVGTVAGTACAGAPWGRALQTLATRSAPCLGRTFQLNLKKKKKKKGREKKRHRKRFHSGDEAAGCGRSAKHVSPTSAACS